MNLNKELILGLGFEEVIIEELNMYRYSFYGMVDPLYLEKEHKEKEFYMVYKIDEENNFTTCGHCENLSGLLEIMMRINNIDSLNLGKELKQKEIKSVLGL